MIDLVTIGIGQVFVHLKCRTYGNCTQNDTGDNNWVGDCDESICVEEALNQQEFAMILLADSCIHCH